MPVIKPNEVSLGVDWIKHEFKDSYLDTKGNRKQLGDFLKYFTDTWMKRYQILDWNISYINGDENLINRTNNPSDKYNKRLN